MERAEQAAFKAPTLAMISTALGTNEVLASLLSREFKHYHFKDQSMFNLTQQEAFSQLITRAEYRGTSDRICCAELVGQGDACTMMVLLDASKGLQQPICAVSKETMSLNPYETIATHLK